MKKRYLSFIALVGFSVAGLMFAGCQPPVEEGEDGTEESEGAADEMEEETEDAAGGSGGGDEGGGSSN